MTLVGAVTLIPGEYNALRDKGRGFGGLSVPGADALAKARSIPAALAQMQMCEAAQVTLEAMLSPQANRTIAATTCLTRANLVLRDNPTMAIAHLARAVSLMTLEERKEAGVSRRMSAQFAANENWITVRRLAASFFFYRPGGDTPDSIDAADVRKLLKSNSYRPALVDLYLRYPAWQAWFTQTMEEQDGRDQRAFLALMRQRRMSEAGL
ncbi:MAG: hypothetical protein GC146_00360 [Limimaricola sp.]|uniref:hypothetical protein n=1 Tax=Limimaricola sp. TaxID=2211665 RepID=UPI001D642448|nr:hypothetical protein [Limimaricola sp.]MBI1415654.1 hypothetical protein [Limimaricola sp.]